MSVVSKRDVNQADWFFFRTAVGAGNSGHRKTKVGFRFVTNAARHVARHLLAHRAEFLD